jgi:two-component system chemotaxis sensor kinase CheA
MPADPYKYFRIEARELLEQLGQGALDLEKGAPAETSVAQLLRFAHTLKGAARVVKQPEIAEHAHQLEDLFGALREQPGQPTGEQISQVLSLLDRIGTRLAGLPGAESQPAARTEHTPIHAVRPDTADLDALVQRVADARRSLDGLRPSVTHADRIRHLVELVDAQLTRTRTRDPAEYGAGQALDRTLSILQEVRRDLATLERGIAASVDHIERELGQVSEVAARLRLVPVSAVFQFLERTARDTAAALDKHVVFHGRGDVRVDSALLSIVQSALLQVVRNAVAHGIEATARDRAAAGKAAAGNVRLTVARLGTSVRFLCEDDGRGVDFDAVRRLLQRKGVAPMDHPIDDNALLGLLLQSSVSTSKTVSDVAGRGIGLDIVRDAAERLGGKVKMRSHRGQGTSVELVVPSSVTSFRGLLVETGGVNVALPLDSVRQTARVAPNEVVVAGNLRSIVSGNSSVPLASLDRIVRPSQRAVPPGGSFSALVLQHRERAAAFSVDRVLGIGTLVMRPLPDTAAATPVVAGVALDASGEPRLVLDPAELIAAAVRQDVEPEPAATRRPSVLVVDDSLTTRMLEQTILESAGFEVDLASSGEQGLEKARAGDFALLLVDVEMPGMDGFQFIEQIRADPRLHETPAILVTSRASAEDRERGRAVGAQGYMVKSDFDQVELLDRIRALVR